MLEETTITTAQPQLFKRGDSIVLVLGAPTACRVLKVKGTTITVRKSGSPKVEAVVRFLEDWVLFPVGDLVRNVARKVRRQ